MPELPEVEVTRRRIGPLLVGRRIREVCTTRDSRLFLTRPARLRARLTGRRVASLGRRGKYLVAEFDDGVRLVVHLGMTGQLFSSAATSPRLLSATRRASLAPEAQGDFIPDAHTHLRLRFEDGGPEVFLRDVRKFGKLLLLERGESHPRLARLGLDALETTGDGLFAATRRRTASIKALLLDQALISGVGNIYADEALFRAGVRPARRAGRVTRRECERLAGAIREVLERSIETGGSSIRDYVAPDGSDGFYQDERRVYARGGEPCLACGSAIRRTTVAQRGTHYCPKCQS
ncbi:MAG TPA: bifunctional DNA-formamidopyrimidine glycosylase/DNA-(apurinic or apyrimidinic site) lyase [Myxococcota bacterium]